FESACADRKNAVTEIIKHHRRSQIESLGFFSKSQVGIYQQWRSTLQLIGIVRELWQCIFELLGRIQVGDICTNCQGCFVSGISRLTFEKIFANFKFDTKNRCFSAYIEISQRI